MANLVVAERCRKHVTKRRLSNWQKEQPGGAVLLYERKENNIQFDVATSYDKAVERQERLPSTVLEGSIIVELYDPNLVLMF